MNNSSLLQMAFIPSDDEPPFEPDNIIVESSQADKKTTSLFNIVREDKCPLLTLLGIDSYEIYRSLEDLLEDGICS